MPRALVTPLAAVLLIVPSCTRGTSKPVAVRHDLEARPRSPEGVATAPGPTTSPVTQALIDAVDRGTDAEAVAAVLKLARLAHDDPAAMAALRRETTSDRIFAAAVGLSKGADRMTADKTALRDALTDPDAYLRMVDAKAKMETGAAVPAPGGGRPEVLGGDDWTPEQAARRIREGSPRDAVLAIVELKWNAAKFPGSVEVLREALKHNSSDVRSAAARALAEIKPDDPALRKELVKLLDTGTIDQRVEAGAALAGVRPPVKGLLDTLREGVRKGQAETQANALWALRAMGKDAAEAVPDVEPLLISDLMSLSAYEALQAIAPVVADDPALKRNLGLLRWGAHADRIKAAAALAQMGQAGKPALWGLAWWSNSQNTAEGAAVAIDALSKIAPDNALAFAAIAKAYGRAGAYSWSSSLRDPEDRPTWRITARATADALTRMKPPPDKSVGPLLLLLGVPADADTLETRAVAEAAHERLRAVGADALPELRRRVLGDDPEERLQAVHGMAVLAVDRPEALTFLGYSFASGDREVRLAAVRRAGELGPIAAPLTPKLAELVRDRARQLEGCAALEALAALGPAAKESAPVLRAVALEKPWRNDPIGEQAAIALLKVAPESPEAMDLADRLLKTKHLAEVLQVAPQLAEPGKLAVQIVALAAGRDDATAALAFEALRRIGPRASDAIPVLAQWLDGADNTRRIAAAFALGAIGPAAKEAACPRLGRMIDNPDAAVRRAAAEALVAIDPASPHLASAYLAAVHRCDTVLVQTLAPHVKTAEGVPQRVVPKLTQLSASDPDNGVRDVAAHALRAIGL